MTQQQQQQQQPSVILATASYDHTIRFWEAKSGRCYRTIQYPESQVNRLEITPDKRYLAAAGNPHIRLFDVNSNSPQPVMSYDSHTNNVMAVGFQCDGNWMYSGSEDGTVKIWDLRAPGCQREYESRAAVNTVVLHPNQTELISGDQNGNIRVWDLTANSCSCELMAHSSKDLLDLELKNSSSSNLESTLIVCKNDDLQQLQNSKPTPIDGKPFTSSVPKSHVMGKVKDFLGVMSEANQRLQNDAKDNVEDYDIEVLTGNESEYIEMDLMLGVADLHTPEAVSAAQSAIVGYQPVISLAASSSETESESSSDDSEDDSDDDYNDDNATATPPKLKRAKSVEDDSSSESSKKHKPKKQPKIVELS